MKDILKTLALFVMGAVIGVQEAIIIATPYVIRYLKGLLLITSIAVLLPLPFAVIGIVKEDRLWMTGCAGLWCSVFLLLLFVWGAPLGILVESLLNLVGRSPSIVGTPFKILWWLFFGKRVWTQQPGGTWVKVPSPWISGDRYVKIVRGILLWETFAYFFLSVVPLRNKWSVVPTFLLGIGILVIAAIHWGWQRGQSKWFRPTLYSFVGLVVALCVISFAFPKATISGVSTWLWNLFADNVPYHGWVLVGILAVIGLVAWKKWGPKTVHAAATTSPHGGSASPWPAILIVAAIFGGLVVFRELVERPDLRARLLGTGEQTEVVQQVQPVDRNFRVFARPQQVHREFVGRGTNICWSVEGPGHIMYRFNGGPWKEDWSGQMIRMPEAVGDQLVEITSAGDEVVPVRFYLTLVRR